MSNELERGNITFTEYDTSNIIQSLKSSPTIQEVINNYCDGYSLDMVYKVLSKVIKKYDGCDSCKHYRLIDHEEGKYMDCTEYNGDGDCNKFKLDLTKVIHEYDIKL